MAWTWRWKYKYGGIHHEDIHWAADASARKLTVYKYTMGTKSGNYLSSGPWFRTHDAGTTMAQRDTVGLGKYFTVGYSRPLEEVLKRIEKVFRDELDTYTGDSVRILIDPTEQPRYCKARPVPYAMRNKVEAELQ
jgi:hypothetical protein